MITISWHVHKKLGGMNSIPLSGYNTTMSVILKTPLAVCWTPAVIFCKTISGASSSQEIMKARFTQANWSVNGVGGRSWMKAISVLFTDLYLTTSFQLREPILNFCWCSLESGEALRGASLPGPLHGRNKQRQWNVIDVHGYQEQEDDRPLHFWWAGFSQINTLFGSIMHCVVWISLLLSACNY